MRKTAEEIADDVLEKLREELPPGTLAGSGIGKGTGVGARRKIRKAQGGRLANIRKDDDRGVLLPATSATDAGK